MYICGMANALKIIVKETLPELKKMLKSSPPHHTPKLKMLIIIKQSELDLNKNELADQVGVNHNSIQTWRRKYLSGGMKALLSDGRIGFKPSVISKKTHEQIRLKLHNPQGAFTSYKELQHWVDTHFEKGINYNTLRHYVKRHFGAKLKIARKSHVKKDKEAIAVFKKTSVKSAKKK
jgi:transposase